MDCFEPYRDVGWFTDVGGFDKNQEGDVRSDVICSLIYEKQRIGKQLKGRELVENGCSRRSLEQ